AVVLATLGGRPEPRQGEHECARRGPGARGDPAFPRRPPPPMKRSAPAPAEPTGPEVSRGAEAKLHQVEWLGLDALRKERDAKAYRPKALDDRLRRERTRNEVRLLLE